MSSKPNKGGAPRTYGQSGRQRRREAEEAARRQRTRTIAFISVLAVLVVGAVAAAIALSGGTHSGLASPGTTVTTSLSTTATTAVAQNPGPETSPVPGGSPLAPATTPGGATVDGIQCQTNEQVAYHIHVHLAVFIDGQQVQIPAGIGIPNPANQEQSGDAFVAATVCYYWLHTHAADGIIHIEAPTAKLYTLGNFFDEWEQPLGPTQIAGQKGQVTAFVDGKPFTGDPRTIVLNKHTVIQLDLGNPVVPFQSFSQWGSL